MCNLRGRISNWNNRIKDFGTAKLVSLEWKTSKLTERLMAYAINYAHITFTTPLRYPKDGKLEICTSKWHRRGHWLNFGITGLIAGFNILSTALKIQQGKFTFKNRLDVFRALEALLIILGFSFQLSLSYYANEVCALWNALLTHVKRVKKSTGLSQRELSDGGLQLICQALMILFIVDTNGVQMIYVLNYLINCSYHTCSDYLPICNEQRQHASWPLVPFYFGLINFYSVQCVCSILITACLIVVGAQTICYGLKILRIQSSYSEQNGQLSEVEENEWNINYTSLRLLMQLLLSAIGAIIIPWFFALVLVILVVSNLILLEPGSDILSQSYAATISSGFILFIILVIQDATKFPSISARLLLTRRKCYKNGGMNLLFARKYLKSCRTINVWVGRFLHLEEGFLLEMLDMVIDCTIDALLA